MYDLHEVRFVRSTMLYVLYCDPYAIPESGIQASASISSNSNHSNGVESLIHSAIYISILP